MLYHR